MDNTEVKKRIIFQCNDQNGFLITLLAGNEFSADKYQQLLNAISQYATEIDDNSLIDRQVVGCLFTLLYSLENLISRYTQMNHPNISQIENAHARIWHLVTEDLLK
jgi:hypothetical protein